MEGGKQIKRSGTDDRIEFDWNNRLILKATEPVT